MPDKIVKADKIRDKLIERADNIGFLEGLSGLKNYLKTNSNTFIFVGEELKKLHQPLEYKDYLKILNLSWLDNSKS